MHSYVEQLHLVAFKVRPLRYLIIQHNELEIFRRVNVLLVVHEYFKALLRFRFSAFLPSCFTSSSIILIILIFLIIVILFFHFLTLEFSSFASSNSPSHHTACPWNPFSLPIGARFHEVCFNWNVPLDLKVNQIDFWKEMQQLRKLD